MQLDATAEALAGTEPVAPAEITPEADDDAALDAAFDKASDEGSDQPDDPPDQPEEAEAEADDDIEALTTDAPTELPGAVRDAWKDIPERAREAILASQREMSRKLADQGRQVSGLGPIRDSLTQAIKDLPSLADMRPEELAADLTQLAAVSAKFREKPVETLLGLAKEHGVAGHLARALSGQDTQDTQEVTALKGELRDLRQQLTRVADPQFLREQYSNFHQESATANVVTDFAATRADWAEVEPMMPAAIQIAKAKLGESASPQDVLTAAYDLLQPKSKASEAPAEEAGTNDPARTEAARKAKDINVKSRSTGSARNLTEDEAMDAAYERASRKG